MEILDVNVGENINRDNVNVFVFMQNKPRAGMSNIVVS